MEIPGGKTHLSDNNDPVRLWTQLFLHAHPVSLIYFSQMDSLPPLCGPVAYKVCDELCLKQGSFALGKEMEQVL